MTNKKILLIAAGGAALCLIVIARAVTMKQDVRQFASNNNQSQISVTVPPRTKGYPALREPSPLPSYSGPNDVIPPTVVITSPKNMSAVQKDTPVTISANVTDNTGVGSVEFLVRGQPVCTLHASPYTCIWDAPSVLNGNFVIVVRAYDLTGNVTSKNVLVTTK